MKYKIIADSSANIYEREGGNYSSVPLSILVDGKEYIDQPGIDLTDLLQTLKITTSKSSTSCPNPQCWLDSFDDAEHVFAITITSALSGSHNSALQAKRDYIAENPKRRVHVIDSRSAGPEMLLLIEKIEECIQKGHSYDSIKNIVVNYQKHTHLLFNLESLTNLANNGRVSPTVAKLAGILGIQIVGKASEEGTLEVLKKVRGAKGALNGMYKEMIKSGYHGGKVRIGHCFNSTGAKTLRDTILKDFPNADVSIHPLTGLCSFYAEINGLMIGYEDW